MSGVGVAVGWGAHPASDVVDAISSGIAVRGHDPPRTEAVGRAVLVHAQFATTPEAVDERQPMRHATHDWWLVADARIDNRAELLEQLRGTSEQATDAELILSAYAQWGAELGRHLIGDFAFVVWDAEREQLLLCRDHLGIRPLLWTRENGLTIAASTVAAVVDSLRLPELDDQHLAHCATFSTFDVVGTPWRGVERVPPATTLVFNENGLRERHSFWNIAAIPVDDDPPTGDQIRAAFDAAVSCRLRAVGGVGVELSGGFDSTTVAATAKRLAHSSLTGFSLVFPGSDCDESSYVSAAEAEIGLEVNRVNALDQDEYDFVGQCRRDRTVPPTPDQRWDEPFARAAGERGCRVVLTGQGGDQLLTGNAEDDALDAISRLHVRDAWRDLADPEATRVQHAGSLAHAIAKATMLRVEKLGCWARPLQLPIRLRRRGQQRDRRQFLGPRLAAVSTEPPRWAPTRLGVSDSERRALYVPMMSVFADLWDRTGTAAGVEYRHPFLDVRLVELALRVPASRFARNGDDRALHKDWFGSRLPRAVLERDDKAEFGDPWVRSGLTLARRLDDAAEHFADLVDVHAWRRTTSALSDGNLESANIWAWWGATAVLALAAVEAGVL